MATYSWAQAPTAPATPIQEPELQPFRGPRAWVEKYRAALLEIDPQARLERIVEADASLQCDAARRLDPRERDAIDEAREILTLLREGIERRVGQASWLL